MAAYLSNAELEELDCGGAVDCEAAREIRELRELVADMKPLIVAGPTNSIWKRLEERSTWESHEAAANA